MVIHGLSKSLSFLAVWMRRKVAVSLRAVSVPPRQFALSFGLLAVVCGCSWGAESFVTSTNTVLMQDFVAATTDQFLSVVTPNPFAPATYSINLLGLNPNYVAPGQLAPSLPCALDEDVENLIAISTQTYLYGWRDGGTYFQQNETGFVGAMADLCQNATNFALVNATTTTWNPATCQDSLAAVVNQLFSVETGTPTVIPGEP